MNIPFGATSGSMLKKISCMTMMQKMKIEALNGAKDRFLLNLHRQDRTNHLSSPRLPLGWNISCYHHLLDTLSPNRPRDGKRRIRNAAAAFRGVINAYCTEYPYQKYYDQSIFENEPCNTHLITILRNNLSDNGRIGDHRPSTTFDGSRLWQLKYQNEKCQSRDYHPKQCVTNDCH